MDENIIKFEQYLAYLSEKLAKPTEFVYDLVLRQVYFEGVVAGLAVLVALFFMWFAYKKVYPGAWEQMDDYDTEVLGVIMFVFCVVVGIIGPIITVINVTTLLQILINPHWYMIKMVAGLAK